MAELLLELARLARIWGFQRLQQWRTQALTALARERRRAFDAVVLLGLGLVLCTVGLCGLLLVAWWALPEPARVPAMAALLMLVIVFGAALLLLARRRLDQP